MAKRKHSKLGADLVDVLRAAIIDSELSRYEIAKLSGVAASVLSRFVSGERGMTLTAAAKVAKVLGLVLVKTKRGTK